MSGMRENPEIGTTVDVGGVATNYHQVGTGEPVVLVHGSGPGVSAWANWRLTIPALAERYAVYAPDLLGFGYTEPAPGATYDLAAWRDHLLGFADAVGLRRFHLVGNSFGGALALSVATTAPQRVGRMVLMGAVGVPFEITEGLDAVWGYEPSIEAMRQVLDVFAYDRGLVTDELALLRYEASVRPGVQEAFAAMFPAPRQRWVDAMTLEEDLVRGVPHPTLIVHGRDDGSSRLPTRCVCWS
jgi:2-hydroxymuconate-semialdehyde hydrolase